MGCSWAKVTHLLQTQAYQAAFPPKPDNHMTQTCPLNYLRDVWLKGYHLTLPCIRHWVRNLDTCWSLPSLVLICVLGEYFQFSASLPQFFLSCVCTAMFFSLDITMVAVWRYSHLKEHKLIVYVTSPHSSNWMYHWNKLAITMQKCLWQGTQKLLVASAKCYILFKCVDMQYMLVKLYILQQNSCLSSERAGKHWCKVPDFRAGTTACAVSKAMEIKLDEDYKVSLEYEWLMLKYKNDMGRSVRSRMQKIGKSSIPAAFAVHFLSSLFACLW